MATSDPIVIRAEVIGLCDQRGRGPTLELRRPDDEHGDDPHLLGRLEVVVRRDDLRHLALGEILAVTISLPERAVGAISTDAIATDAVHGGGLGGS